MAGLVENPWRDGRGITYIGGPSPDVATDVPTSRTGLSDRESDAIAQILEFYGGGQTPQYVQQQLRTEQPSRIDDGRVNAPPPGYVTVRRPDGSTYITRLDDIRPAGDDALRGHSNERSAAGAETQASSASRNSEAPKSEDANLKLDKKDSRKWPRKRKVILSAATVTALAGAGVLAAAYNDEALPWQSAQEATAEMSDLESVSPIPLGPVFDMHLMDTHLTTTAEFMIDPDGAGDKYLPTAIKISDKSRGLTATANAIVAWNITIPEGAIQRNVSPETGIEHISINMLDCTLTPTVQPETLVDDSTKEILPLFDPANIGTFTDVLLSVPEKNDKGEIATDSEGNVIIAEQRLVDTSEELLSLQQKYGLESKDDITKMLIAAGINDATNGIIRDTFTNYIGERLTYAFGLNSDAYAVTYDGLGTFTMGAMFGDEYLVSQEVDMTTFAIINTDDSVPKSTIDYVTWGDLESEQNAQEDNSNNTSEENT